MASVTLKKFNDIGEVTSKLSAEEDVNNYENTNTNAVEKKTSQLRFNTSRFVDRLPLGAKTGFMMPQQQKGRFGMDLISVNRNQKFKPLLGSAVGTSRNDRGVPSNVLLGHGSA